LTVAALLFAGASAASRTDSLQSALSQSQSTAYSTLPDFTNADITSPLKLAAFSIESMSATFDDVQDTLPSGRPKLIHPRGALAPVTFTITGDSKGHTGLFATGGDSCVARLSLAANPTSIGFTPGMAIKCYRDGQASGNIIAMYSLDGQKTNWNFFANEFSNIITDPTSIALKAVETLVFKRASSCPIWLSLKQWSEIDQDGNTAATPSWPQQMFFVPAGVQFSSDSTHGDFRDDLASIAVGTKLWDIYVSDVHNDGARYKLAEVTTTGQFVASSFTDGTLFFQHDRGEEDNCGN